MEGRISQTDGIWHSAFALIAGTIFAIVVVPALASFALRGRIAEHESWIVRWLLRLVSACFELRLAQSWSLVVAYRGDLLVAGGVIFSFLGSEFLPKLDEGDSVGAEPSRRNPSRPSGMAAKITQKGQRKRLIAYSRSQRYVVEDQEGRPDNGS